MFFSIQYQPPDIILVGEYQYQFSQHELNNGWKKNGLASSDPMMAPAATMWLYGPASLGRTPDIPAPKNSSTRIDD